MDNFVKLPISERKPYFLKAASDLSLPVNVVEKDFWVCWTLRELFSITGLSDHLTFKGGTSLSKVYKLIKRFSEDIDVSIEKEFLGFVGEKDPSKADSSKKAQRLIEELGQECKKYVQGTLLQALQERTNQQFELKIDFDDNDGQTILFYYPTEEKRESYVRPAVKIEFGARAEHWPTHKAEIEAYISEAIPAVYAEKRVQIKVLNSERTFWEKATILHRFGNYPSDKIVPIRQSRHYYDFYCLLISEVKGKALSDLTLLQKVCDHKKLYFKEGWAKYDDARTGALKLIPDARVLSEMEKDYKEMQEMLFEKTPVSWKTILDEIMKLKV